MRRALAILCSTLLLVAATSAMAATSGRVAKVLPHLLDLEGRHALSPSLYERDAYQAYLRKWPDQVSGMRFDVKWKAPASSNAKLKLRVELRSDARNKVPNQKTIESEVEGRGRWSSVSLLGEDYKAFGKVTAWRVTLWNGEELVGEQKSFLW